MNDQAAGGRAPASGGAVDRSVLQDLVYANQICADQGVLDGYGHCSVRHPNAHDRYFLSRSLSKNITGASLRIWSPKVVKPVLVKQMSPDILDLMPMARRVDEKSSRRLSRTALK